MNDEERRYAAFSAVEEARTSGDDVRLGKALTALSRLGRDIPIEEGTPPFVSAAKFGAEAVEVLRRTDDLASLASALRAAAVPFMIGIDQEALLEESLAVARRAEAPEQEAWTLFALGGFRHDPLRVRQALQIFERIGDRRSIATCRQRLAIAEGLDGRGKAEAFVEAAEAYLEAGDSEDASRSFMMAAVFGGDALSLDEKRELLHRSLDASVSPKDRALTYRNLAWNRDEAGQPEEAARYRQLEDDLDVAAYGSRAKRLEEDIEVLTEDLEMASRRDRKAIRLKISTLRIELDTLSEG